MFKNCLFAATLLLFACANTPVAPSATPATVSDTFSTSVPLKPTAPANSSVKAMEEAAPVSSSVGKPASTKSDQAKPKVIETAMTPLPAPDPSQLQANGCDAWEALLTKYVSASGKVNYKGLKADKAGLEECLQTLSATPPPSSAPRAEKMAYWINVYNAYTIALILDHYPVSSITKLDGGKPWDVKRIDIGGKKYSLNQIENDILRPQFKDPRIHFALNCAARSCPPLWNHVFTPENLDKTLDERTRRFINDASYNSLSADKATVSKIFDWYGADFGDLRSFLNKYANTKMAANATVQFQDYNWDLNEQ